MPDTLLNFQAFMETQSTINDIAGAGNGYLYSVESDNSVREFNLGTCLATGKSVVLTGSPSPAVITMVNNGASALIGTNNQNNLYLVETIGLYYQSYATATSIVPGVKKSQQAAWNPISGYAVVTSGTNGAVSWFNSSAYTTGSWTMTGHTSEDFFTVIPCATSGNFIVGSNKGTILEINTSGSIVATKSLSFTNNTGAAPTPAVVSMVYYNGFLTVSLANGIIQTYNYGTMALVDQTIGGSCNTSTSNAGVLMCTTSSSQVVWTDWMAKATQAGIRCGYLQSSGALFEQEVQVISGQTQVPTSLGYDSSSGKLWVCYGGQDLVFVFQAKVPVISQVPTRVQNPPGVDVAARIIRIRDYGPGRSEVVYDGNVSPGATSLPAIKGGEYYEIAITGTFPTQQYDWRKFNV